MARTDYYDDPDAPTPDAPDLPPADSGASDLPPALGDEPAPEPN